MNDENKKQEKEILVPESWLEGLLTLAERSKDEKDKTGMWLLIGYISSAKTIIKYGRKPNA